MSKPKALLVQPPIYDFALYDLFLQPYGLLRVARWLEETGYDVELLDALDPAPPRKKPGRGRFFREPVPTPPVLSGVARPYARYGAPRLQVEDRISAANPDLVLLTSGMTYWYPGVREVSRAVRKISAAIPIIVGGIYATLIPDHCRLQSGSDLVVTGSADEQLPGILERAGFPVPEGPVPAFPAVDLQSGSGRLTEAAAIRLTEGCPFRCLYCASGLLAPRHRASEPGDLIGHVAELNRRYGVTVFAFYDDALLARSSPIVPFLEGVIDRFGERSLEFHLPNAVHLDSVDRDLAHLMNRAGFAEVRFGLESTDPGFHRSADSKIHVDGVAERVDELKGAGFAGNQITAYLLAGLPGQPFESLRDGFRFAESLRINVSVSEYSPVPGTELFDRAVRETGLDLGSEPLLHNSSVYPQLSGSITAQELDEIRSSVRQIRRNLMV